MYSVYFPYIIYYNTTTTSHYKTRLSQLPIIALGYRAQMFNITAKCLIRRNFRADKFSRTCSARKLEIFARINFRAPSDFEISKT